MARSRHLRSLLKRLDLDKVMRTTFGKVLVTGRLQTHEMVVASRLMNAGLIQYIGNDRYKPTNQLYAMFFEKFML